ncbi:MAG: hypothetical protein ACRD9L_11350, partial [Bryobacteraceae bacterium]
RTVTGLFAALSYDEGETWPVKRLITDDKPDHPVQRMDGHLFTMGPNSAEPSGYMSVGQTADGVINLITSREHYAFNLAWIKTPMPAEKEEEIIPAGFVVRKRHAVRQTLRQSHELGADFLLWIQSQGITAADIHAVRFRSE